MALSDQIDFPAFFSLRKLTYRNFINSGIRQSAIAFAPYDGLTPPFSGNWLSGIDRLRKVNVSVTESITDCWKERRSVTLTKHSQLIIFKPLKMVLCSFCDGVPLKFKRPISRPMLLQWEICHILDSYRHRSRVWYRYRIVVEQPVSGFAFRSQQGLDPYRDCNLEPIPDVRETNADPEFWWEEGEFCN
jgi:hypothetical protein